MNDQNLLSATQLDAAISRSSESFKSFRFSTRYVRSHLLLKIAEGIQKRREEIRRALIQEAKKPYALSDIEITRAINTFTIASEEAKRFGGEVFPIDGEASAQGYGPALTQWVPRGPVLAITPYNFPLNLVAHKVAPALAAGASVLVKPPPQAPTASLILEKIFLEAAKSPDLQGLVPEATVQVVQASNDVMAIALKDERIPVLSFTGSDTVGWMLKEKAPRKKVVLELGGNAAAIVHGDCDIKRAAQKCAMGAFAYAGQVCISVQRIFVQKQILSQFAELFIEEVKALKVGDPSNKDTIVGPAIDQKSAEKILNWIDGARRDGASILYQGEPNKGLGPCFVPPTVLSHVSNKSKLFTEEAFGPVAIINSYENFSEAIEAVNDSQFGLQAGLFTDSSKLIEKAYLEIQTGGLIINDSPTFRADVMPYGGFKNSGEGREGVRFAMEEFCQRKTLIKWLGESRGEK